MEQNFAGSLKKRVRGLMALVLAIATIVAVFPPIDAQATSDENYYVFLTGFNESDLDIGYFIATPSEVEYELDNALYVYEEYIIDHRFNNADYSDFVNYYTSNYENPLRTLSSVNIPASNTSTVSYLSLDEDAEFLIWNYYDDYSYLEINYNGSQHIFFLCV